MSRYGRMTQARRRALAVLAANHPAIVRRDYRTEEGPPPHVSTDAARWLLEAGLAEAVLGGDLYLRLSLDGLVLAETLGIPIRCSAPTCDALAAPGTGFCARHLAGRS